MTSIDSQNVRDVVDAAILDTVRVGVRVRVRVEES